MFNESSNELHVVSARDELKKGWSLPSSGRDLCAGPTTDELKKKLECPVCFEIPLPPVYQCKMGHIICSCCKNKVQKCGLCQHDFTTCRNFLHEDIVESSRLRCDYSGCGCGKMIAGLQLKAHLEGCKFRPIKCHFCCNNVIIKMSEYLDHLQNIHKVPEVTCLDGAFSQEYSLTSPRPKGGSWFFKFLKFDGEQFLTYSFWLGTVTYFCVFNFGDDTDASAYSVQISFGEGSQVPRFEATVTVLSIRNYVEQLTNLGIVVMNEGSLRLIGSSIKLPGQGGDTIKWRVNYKIKKNPLTVVHS